MFVVDFNKGGYTIKKVVFITGSAAYRFSFGKPIIVLELESDWYRCNEN